MKFSMRVDIRATPEEVFYWLGDPRRAMAWMTSVTKTEYITQTPNMIGSRFREYVEEDGQAAELRGVITDFTPNERIAFWLESDYNTAQVVFSLERRGESTLLTQDVDLRFRGVTRLLSIFFGPAFKKKITRQSQSEFARLKELCEAGAGS